MYHINKEITASGENIALNNTARHYFKSFDILGNSVQEGTPSINSEAPIESVGDNINEYNANVTFPINKNGLTITKEDDESITINGTATQNTNYVIGIIPLTTIEEMNGKEYTLSLEESGTGSVNNSGLKHNGSDRFIVSSNLPTKTGIFTKVDTDTKDYSWALWIISGTVFTNYNLKLKLSKGTSTGAYSPYGQGSIDIKHYGKNYSNFLHYADGKTEGVTNYGITYKIVNEYSSIISGKPSATEFRVGNVWNSTEIVSELLKKKQYIFENNLSLDMQVTIVNSANNTYRQVSIKNKEVITLLDDEDGISSLRINIDTNTTYDNTLLEYDIYDVEQYQTKALYTQQPFRAIGDVKDRFVKVDGVKKEQHPIFRKIFDGTENWLYQDRGNGIYRFNILLDNAINLSGRNQVLSNYFLYKGSSEEEGNCFISEKYVYFYSRISSINDFKSKLTELYNAGTPVYVDYVLATPTLIECTPEQVEQLESIEKEAYSYDEVTHIYSTDEVSPYFEVTAYERISEEFKTRLKEGKITRGYLKVLATDTLPEIIINENNYLKDLKIEELRYVPEEGIIGGTVAKRVSGNFNNVDSSFDIQDREIEVYLGVELEDETTEYIKYGTYIVQRPEDDQVNDNTSFEALDYMIKFNQEYKDRITYPCTLKQLLNDIIEQAGVNSKVATFANSDFVVENNQFEQGSTLRDVLKAITQVAFNWSRIDADDNLVMDFEIREETDEELGTDDYFSFKKTDEYGPVNVVVLRNSQVEGENVTIKDDKLINEPIGYNLFNFSTITRSENLINNNDGTFSSKNSKSNVTINCAADSVPYDAFSLSLGEYYIYMKIKTTSAVTLTNFYICTQNNNDVSQNIQKPLNITLPVNTETIIKTNVTLSEDKPKVGFVAYFDATTDFTVSDIMVSKSKEEKPYQPYIPIGEIEYVISDNPFAYTELKRKQLIEAGKRLFGLRYTPMTVDMLGLMYLNSKDRISVENLNGQKYNTYLFDHTIDYTGIVLDSMESKSKTKTETKYQYVSSLAQGLSHVEIKVDKANKRIESIIESQEDVSEKVAKTVARIEVVYALSDSPTTAPTDGWSTTAPEWTAGKYMWQKTITTYANGTTAETAATNISGAKGEAGKNGIGITQTNITYQKSTSGTTVPTGTWQTTIPEVDEDGYLWTRTEFIYSDGSKKYAYNVGKKGATGIGVKSIIDQYYSSTSSTELAGGEWKETQDTLQTDRFIWTRSKITWTNESVTYTDPILANTLNDINSNIIVFKDFKASQESTNQSIKSSIQETTRKLNDEYLTADKVNEKIDKIDDDYTILESRVAQTELDSKSFKVSIETIQNTGVDKIKTSMGYTFNDDGLNIDRTGSDTSTVIDEAKIKVTDKTGGQPKSLLYAGYVKEGDTEFSDYEGQTIVATSNLIVQNFLIIGSNSRFQDYYNETLGGNGTGAFDI